MIVLQNKFHGKDLQVDGLTYKRCYHKKRDVDYDQVMKLLLKFNANPRLESSNKYIPIFKAIKRSSMTLQLFLEFDDQRT